MYTNQMLERKTKEVADALGNQMISSIDVLVALAENRDIVSKILNVNGFSYKKISSYHYRKYDQSRKGEYIISPFAKILLNTESNEEAISSIVNNECVAHMAMNSIKGLTFIVKDFFKEIPYYNYDGVKTGGKCKKSIRTKPVNIEPVKKQDFVSNEKESLYSLDVDNIRINLKKEIIGQDNAIEMVLSAIMRGFCGLTNENAPKARFLFCGPTGVGKTELAKVLAKNVNYNLIKMDMSEYQEKVSLTKLIGAAPGYAGYEEGGQLTSAIEKNPKSIIIFDEIEKANYDIFSVFLQILDEGRLTDNKGKTFNFSESIIVFTSNVGVTDESSKLSYNNYMREIKNTFKPEFINRLDDIVIFERLNLNSLEKIINKELILLKERLYKNQNISLIYDYEFVSWFLNVNINYININYGARETYRLIQRQISSTIAEGICKGYIAHKSKIVLVKDTNNIYKLNKEKN